MSIIKTNMSNNSKSNQNEIAEKIAIEKSLKQLKEGFPVFVILDEIVNEDTIKGHLLIDAFGLKADQRITLKKADGHTSIRTSLKSHIAGNDYIAPLIKGDIIGFDKGYVENNMVMVGAVSARVHDKMLGEVQVMTAMTKPTIAFVNKKGASQSGIIADGKNTVVVNSNEGLKAAFEKVKSEKGLGTNPGFIIRNKQGHIADFFENKDTTIDHLIEDLTHHGFNPSAENLLELIPAWSLPMGKDQITKDVNPKVENPKGSFGNFSQQYLLGKDTGFIPSLVIISNEEEWAFGGKTGKIIPVISAMEPVYKRKALEADILPTCKRAYGGTPNTILKLYNEQKLTQMKADRVKRRGYEDPIPEKKANPYNKNYNNSDNHNEGYQEEYRPMGRTSFGRK